MVRREIVSHFIFSIMSNFLDFDGIPLWQSRHLTTEPARGLTVGFFADYAEIGKFHRSGKSGRSVRHLDTVPVVGLPVRHLVAKRPALFLADSRPSEPGEPIEPPLWVLGCLENEG